MYPEPFNPELTRILDRVYGVQLVDGVDRAARPIKAELSRQRRQRGAEALERALEDLRQLRERSQGTAALKDELDYLHNQIAELKTLGEQITRLRVQLGDPPAETIGEGDAMVQDPQGGLVSDRSPGAPPVELEGLDRPPGVTDPSYLEAVAG